MIQFINVSKTFSNGYTALNAINLNIHSGELVLLTGPSGSGKTTLFKLIQRMSTPTQGSIIINREDIAELSKKQLPYFRRSIACVAQNPQLLLNQTVFDNIALALMVCGYRKKYINMRVNAALRKLGLLSKSHLHAASLSSGEQKRTEIARAIVTAPKILLVDEPTANVDAATALEMLDLLRAFNQIGITVIIASNQHDLLQGRETQSITINHGCLDNVEKIFI